MLYYDLSCGKVVVTSLLVDYEKLGLILLGSCPGGAASNFWTAMLGGDVNLSVTMTLVSSVASFGMTSLWAYVLGNPLLSHGVIKVPYHMIAISLASFAIPIGLGVLWKYKWPKRAERVGQLAARPFFLLCLIILPTIAAANSKFMFYLLTWRHVLSGFLLGVLGYICGAGMALICCQERAQVIAISLETAIQNGGIAFVVLNLTFPSPYADIGCLPVIAFFMCSTGPIMFVVYGIYLMYRCTTGKSSIQQVRQEFRGAKSKAKGETVEETLPLKELSKLKSSDV